jgi:2-keto-4-pentenoate hydratase/2-oxohepta-3-ene-1,7-dioic acid hydratase in catechol pathway
MVRYGEKGQMKIVAFKHESGWIGGGVLSGETIRRLPAGGSDDVLAYVTAGAKSPLGEEVPLDKVTLLAPLQRPTRIFGIGLNYREHAAESKMAVQSVPTVFLKLSSSVTGPDSEVLLWPEATQPDYEAELAVVIGKPGHRISKEKWREHVFGYTIVNDVSARGVQLATSQWTLGKSFPTFTPMGPWIVTADEIQDPHQLDIRLTLNDEVMQSANTRDLIFNIPDLISHISSIVPLEAGDVISTGTPPGVGLGRNPQRWLLPGETMTIEIEGIGTLRNRTRAQV